ncbi:MAG: DUF3656 domain-containing protein, partial [Eubacterium sp.]
MRPDKAAGKASQNTVSDKDLMQVFNREFTKGHLFSQKDIINDNVGRNRGIYIGKVTGCERDRISIGLSEDGALSAGDGLSFGEDASKGMKADVLYTPKGKRVQSAKLGTEIITIGRFSIKPGTPVYRNYDKALMERLKAGCTPVQEKAPGEPLDFKVSIHKNEPIKVQIENVHYQSEIIPSAAERKPLDKETVAAQISKLGNTGYALGQLEITLDDGLFLAKSQLNTLRKEAVEAYENRAGAASLEPEVSLEDVSFKAPVIHLEEERNQPEPTQKPLVSLEILRAEKCEDYYDLPVDELVLPVEKIEDLGAYATRIDGAKEAGKRVLIAFPRIMNTKDTEALRAQMQTIKGWHHDG